MISRFATPYDQNPARLAMIVNGSRKKRQGINLAKFSILVTVGLCLVYAVHHMAV